jgi:hypothetical protein
MTKRQKVFYAALVSAALTAVAAPPAFAAPTDLYLDGFSFGFSGGSGTLPGIADNGATVSTSNYGTVTTLTASTTHPYEFIFNGTGSTNEVIPVDPLFVVEPNGTSSSAIAVTFDFLYGSTVYDLMETVDFSATLPDTDSLVWQKGSNGVCNGSQTTYATGTECTYTFAINGIDFSIMMDNEMDWNMAEFDGASIDVGPVKAPEPASIAMFGAGLLGLGMLWHRRRQRRTTTAA